MKKPNIEDYNQDQIFEYLANLEKYIDYLEKYIEIKNTEIEDKLEIEWLINDTYQVVDQSNHVLHQGTLDDCNDFLTGYCK